VKTDTIKTSNGCKDQMFYYETKMQKLDLRL